MKLKSLLAVAAVSAAGIASATVTSDNTLCRVMINSGTTNTIVSIPLVTVAGTAESIDISALILTNNLTAGDSVLLKNGEGWYAWSLGKSGWEKADNASGVTAETTKAPSDLLDRGSAVWVNRQDPSKPFYIYGQISTNDATSVTITGSDSASTYTYVGNPNPDAYPLTTPKTKWSGLVANDRIIIPDSTGAASMKEYVWNGSDFGTISYETNTYGYLVKKFTAATDSTTIPAGQAFWFVTAAGAGERTISW